MQNEPLISIVILLKDSFHLVNLTLKSIVAQTDISYEIIIIENTENKKDLVMLKPYHDNIKKVVHMNDKDMPFLMNKALDLVKGKYVNFLFPGEVYISRYVISHLKKSIEEKKYPNLVCSAYLRRDEIEAPEIVNFSFEAFKKGRLPVKIQNCWFLVDVIKKLNGFDTAYKLQPGFSLICRIFKLKDRNIFFLNRVLTDYQFRKEPSKVFILLAWEKLKIIYKNFGFFKTAYWWIMRDHFKMIKFVLISIKKAFWYS